MKILNTSALGLLLFFANASIMAAEKNLFETTRTIDICTEYHDATDERKEVLYKELDRRAQLSYTDYDMLKAGKKEVAKGSTQCGMYMMIGKPLDEEYRQIRPMVYKMVHIYPTKYVVTQMGMIIDIYDRKEGVMPPKLAHEKPKVQEAPVIYNAPGSPHHGHHQ